MMSTSTSTASELRARLTAAAPNTWPAPEAGPVVVGLSGGVDSALTAWVLRTLGYDVIGITAHLFGGFGDARSYQGCCSLPGSEDARRVAAHLDIPFYVMNLQRDFSREVLDYFAGSYLAGETPNPCVACNKGVKFDVLLKKAQDLGARWLATGHYARIEPTATGRVLAEAVDPAKDQSYFLYFLDQSLLGQLGFPLGGLTKTEVRELAESAGLPVAAKAESQDLCFAPDGDYAAVVEHLRPGASPEGAIERADGSVLGTHRGLIHYTVGQRKGLGLGVPEPLFVLAKDVARNALIVGTREELGVTATTLRDFRRTDGGDPLAAFTCEFRPRYRGPRVPTICQPQPGGGCTVTYLEPGERPAPGQVAVFYAGTQVIGGGIIDQPWRAQAPCL